MCVGISVRAYSKTVRTCFWQIHALTIIYFGKGILVEPLDAEKAMKRSLRKMELSGSDKMNFPKNYTTLFDLFSAFLKFAIPQGTCSLDSHAIHTSSLTFSNFITLSYVINYLCLTFFPFVSHWSGKIVQGNNHHDTENPSNNKQTNNNRNEAHYPFISKEYPVGFLPRNYETFHQFVKSAYVHILGLSGVGMCFLNLN